MGCDKVIDHMKQDISQPDRSITHLDALVVIAESWKILILFPAIVAIITFFVSRNEPRLYQSRALLLMVEAEGGLVIPRDVMQGALKRASSAADPDVVLASLKFGKPSHRVGWVSMVPVSLVLPDPKSATTILEAVLTEYQSRFLNYVREEYRSSFQDELDILQREITSRTRMRDGLLKLLEHSTVDVSALPPVGSAASVIGGLMSLATSLDELTRKQVTVTRQLRLLPKTLISEPASAATLIQGSSQTAAVLMSALGAGLLALIFLFFRDLVRRQALQPGGMDKVARLRRALGMKSIILTADELRKQ